MTGYLRLAILAWLAALTAVCSCASRSQVRSAMDSWLGVHKSLLILQKGPPTSVASDGRAGEILIYSYTRRGTIVVKKDKLAELAGRTKYTATERGGGTTDYMYYADQDGKIYFWRIRRR